MYKIYYEFKWRERPNGLLVGVTVNPSHDILQIIIIFYTHWYWFFLSFPIYTEFCYQHGGLDVIHMWAGERTFITLNNHFLLTTIYTGKFNFNMINANYCSSVYCAPNIIHSIVFKNLFYIFMLLSTGWL